jgi:hypothetical protein
MDKKDGDQRNNGESARVGGQAIEKAILRLRLERGDEGEREDSLVVVVVVEVANCCCCRCCCRCSVTVDAAATARCWLMVLLQAVGLEGYCASNLRTPTQVLLTPTIRGF